MCCACIGRCNDAEEDHFFSGVMGSLSRNELMALSGHDATKLIRLIKFYGLNQPILHTINKTASALVGVM